MEIGRHPHDLPYGCFFVFGGTELALALIRASYTDAEWTDGAGGILLVLMPIILGALLGALVGTVLSVWFWREWPLPLLAATTVAVLLAGFTGSIPPRMQTLLPVIHGTATCLVCVWWYFLVRPRQPPALPPQPAAR